LVLAFSLSLLTLGKTVLYVLVEACSGFKYTHWTDIKLIFWFIAPNGIWLVVPGIIVGVLFPKIVRAISQVEICTVSADDKLK